MRMQGKSYTEIRKALGMSKSTLSAWFRHLVLSQEAQQKITSRSHAASINALLKINKQQTHLAEQRAKITRATSNKEIQNLSRRELLVLGAALYWAEGYKRPIFRDGKPKTSHPVSFTNSDPQMVKMFLKFLREICGTAEEKIKADLRIFDHQNEAHLLEYWAKITNLSYSNFGKVYRGVSISSQRKRPFNALPYGTIQIRVADTPLFHKIMGWIEGIASL